MQDIQQLEKIACQIRRDIVRQVFYVQSGHPGGSLGCVEILTALFFKIMKHEPSFNPEAMGEDVFFLSNGHISPLLYSTLARSAYFEADELATFRKINSRLQGHPATHEHLPGIRVAAGSLGQGLSVACGMALSKKMNQDDRWVFALTGDGELQEGQIWEALMFAAHQHLDNLIVLVDWNGQQIDGPNEKVMSLGDLEGKWRSFGWEVLVCPQGNELKSVIEFIETAKEKSKKGKPVVILTKTTMGFGVDFMMHSHEWHGIAPNKEQALKALSQLPETLGDYKYPNDPLKASN
jgi:transketolase